MYLRLSDQGHKLQNISSHTDHLLSQAQELMKTVFGFREFRPGQEAILEAIFSGEETLVVMPTGGGNPLLSASGPHFPGRLWSSLH
jgi:superfamily II DNA or RNA helicase